MHIVLVMEHSIVMIVRDGLGGYGVVLGYDTSVPIHHQLTQVDKVSALV